MDSEEYFDRVIRFLETNGWNTSPSQLNEQTYLVTGTRKSDTYYDRMLTMVVVEESTPLTEDHLGYLLDAAEEHEVDQTMATSRAGMTEEAAAAVADHDVEFVETETIDDAFVDDFAVENETSGLTNTTTVQTDEDSGQVVVTLEGGFLQLLVGLSLLFAVVVGAGVAVLALAGDAAAAVEAVVPGAVLVVAPALALVTGVFAGARDDPTDPSAGSLFAGTVGGYLAFAFVVGVVAAVFGETGSSVVFASVEALVGTAGLGLLVGAGSVAAALLARRAVGPAD